MPCILYKNQQIPYHAIGWENKFISLTEMNRVVKMVYNLVEKDSFAYHSLSKRLKDQIILVNFDEFVTHSDFYLNTICEFFNTTLTDHTNIVLDRESCPRSIDYNRRKSNLIMINNLSNIQSVDMVSEMIENYEK
jgi:hypothetical protein